MQDAIRDLLALISGDDLEKAQDAIGNIALILERSTFLSYNEDSYTALLPERFCSITLSRKEQREIVDYLTNEIKKGHPSEGSLFWAISKAAVTGTESVPKLLKDHGERFDEATILQALFAYDKYIWALDGLLLEVKSEIQETNIRAFLQKMLLADDIRIPELAQRLLENLEKYD